MILLAGALAGCGSPSTNACENVLPATCPTPAPTWSGQVEALVVGRCGACHSPGGFNPSRLFTNYAQAYAQRVDILTQVVSCTMPPPDGGVMPLRSEERAAVLGWVVCGAKND